MKTVKEYAAEVGKTEEAVYKQLKAKKNKPKLEDHVIKINGVIHLDDVAVEILNESRNVTQVKQDKQLKSENERMIKEIDDLKNKIIMLQMKLQTQTEQMAALVLDNKEKTLLLEQKEDQAAKVDKLITENAELKAKIDLLEKSNEQLSTKVASQSVSEGQKEPKKGFFARLFGK